MSPPKDLGKNLINPAVAPPPDYVPGPAMSKLNDRQQAFVFAMLEFGGIDNTKAAAAAGYSAISRNSLRVQAHQLAHDENIQEAIREEGLKRLKAGSIMAVSRLLEIAHDPGSEKKDQLKAIEMILNRVGMPAQTEQKITVTTRDLTMEQMINKATTLAKGLGLDPKKLLGGVGVVIDAEFVEEKIIAGTAEDDDDLSDLF